MTKIIITIIIVVLAIVGISYGAYYYMVPESEPAELPVGENIAEPPVVPPPLTQSSITVISPKGGEKWEIGKSYTISWNSSNAPAGYSVELYLEQWFGDAYSSNLIKGSLPVIGIYSWSIPLTQQIGSYYRISALLKKSDRKGLINDVSNNYFSIVAVTTIKDWKTYRNEEYRFEFRYPRNWDNPSELTQKTEYDYIDLGCPKKDFEGEKRCPIRITLASPQSKSSFIESVILTPFEHKGRVINTNKQKDIESFNVYKREAIRFLEPGMCVDTSVVIFDSEMTVFFEDHCNFYQDNGIFNQILSTFRFIE